MNNKELYAMLQTSLEKYLETSAEIMNAKNGMTADEMRTAIDEIYSAADVYRTPKSDEDYDNLYTIEGNTAVIPVRGVLTPKANPCAAFFGGAETEYGFIKAAVKKADADYSVRSIVLDIDSPGGAVDGVDEAAQVIAETSKPIVSIGHNMVASAAYWLASQSDKIFAASKTTQFGSIGVAAEVIDSRAAEEKKGVKRHVFTSTDAPKKRLNIDSEDGQAEIERRLNDIHNVFVNRVASGRNTTAEDINKNYGRGSVLIAEDALTAGMIDNIIDYEKSNNSEPSPMLSGNNYVQEADMDFSTYLKENPDAKAEYDASIEAAKAEGREEGKDKYIKEGADAERERILSVIDLAGTKVPEAATETIKSGGSPETYAVNELKAQREKTAKAGQQNLGKFGEGAQTPEDSAPQNENEKALSAWDELYGKKEAE